MPTSDSARQQEIAAIVREYLVAGLRQPIADDEDIFATGLVNSLFAAQLVMFVEDRFEMTVDNDDLDLSNFSSVDAITGFVAKRIGAAAS